MNKPYDTPAADTPRASEPAAAYGRTAPAAPVTSDFQIPILACGGLINPPQQI